MPEEKNVNRPRVEIRILRMLVIVALTALTFPVWAEQEARAQRAERYLSVVRAYADAMIEHGRDTYGEVQSPAFTSVLDRDTFQIPKELPPITDIRQHDRSYGGGNPMHDECLYVLLYDLSHVTGEARYAQEADASLQWYLTHIQSPATGLFAWGEHLYWDFTTEAMGGNGIHEFYRPWVLLDESYRLAPDAMAAYAQGLWFNQISDHEHGHYSRHAKWSEHGPGENAEYPRHGGFYIAQWAEAYKRTGRYVFLAAIESLLDYYERVRNTATGILPAANPATSGQGNIAWPESQLSLSIDLWDAMAKVPRDLAAKMRATAERNDTAFLTLPIEPGDASKGYILSADFSPTKAPTTFSYCPTWASGYGEMTNAGAAMVCYERYLQTKSEPFRQMVLDTANVYRNAPPDTNIELFPVVFSDVINLMIADHRLTGNAESLAWADTLADQSIALFWDNGPLPRASSRTAHYETITRADSLARALLLLWGEESGHVLETRYLDR